MTASETPTPADHGFTDDLWERIDRLRAEVAGDDLMGGVPRATSRFSTDTREAVHLLGLGIDALRAEGREDPEPRPAAWVAIGDRVRHTESGRSATVTHISDTPIQVEIDGEGGRSTWSSGVVVLLAGGASAVPVDRPGQRVTVDDDCDIVLDGPYDERTHSLVFSVGVYLPRRMITGGAIDEHRVRDALRAALADRPQVLPEGMTADHAAPDRVRYEMGALGTVEAVHPRPPNVAVRWDSGGQASIRWAADAPPSEPERATEGER